MAALVFYLTALAFILLWSRYYEKGQGKAFALFIAIVSVYQAETLFTNKVDIPANLLYHAFPWKALPAQPVEANTGIVITELVPWTIEAREALREGEWPLWNRNLATGSPLLANQQTAVFHPFTLLGLALPIGEAWTLSVSLRLLFTLFFTYRFLVGWRLGWWAAVFGAVAFTFSSFSIVWLLFPLGLSNFAIPILLSGLDDLVRGGTAKAFVLPSFGLAMSILGGHPESAAWVAILGALYAVYAAWARHGRTAATGRAVLRGAWAMLLAVGLTAFWWYPTWSLLPETERFHMQQSNAANPADHEIGGEWLTPLLAPNVHGTPQRKSFVAPHAIPITLTDYGEVASGYAGIVASVFALYALLYTRLPPSRFFLGVLLFVFLTIYEVPVWRDAVRALPLVGDVLLQRLRVFWVFGIASLAAVGMHVAVESGRRSPVPFAAAGLLVGGTWFFSLKTWLAQGQLSEQLGYALITATVFALVWGTYRFRASALAPVAVVATLAELWLLTANYNPPARKKDLFPVTPALEVLQDVQKPARVVALGWSLIPDTPGAYGLEDIKSTDPIQHPASRRLYREHLQLRPGDYNQIVNASLVAISRFPQCHARVRATRNGGRRPVTRTNLRGSGWNSLREH